MILRLPRRWRIALAIYREVEWAPEHEVLCHPDVQAGIKQAIADIERMRRMCK